MQESSSNVIKTVIFVSVGVATVIMAVWIWYKMRAVKKTLLEEQSERRAAREKEEDIARQNQWQGPAWIRQ